MFLHLLTRNSFSAASILLGLLIAAPLAAQPESSGQTQAAIPVATPLPGLALMGTVPIYWGEADGLAELLNSSDNAHWARAVLERDYQLSPLDFLTPQALSGHDFLLMAQPRALSAEENVALDDWVRSGGRLLLLADPMMTGETRFSLGDRRRPQDVALLSPILSHWGLELVFDEAESSRASIELGQGQMLPVRRAGQFRLAEGGEDCLTLAESWMARCDFFGPDSEGTGGRVVLLGDAAILDFEGPIAGAEGGFQVLLRLAFADFAEIGDDAGGASILPKNTPENGGNASVLAQEEQENLAQ